MLRVIVEKCTLWLVVMWSVTIVLLCVSVVVAIAIIGLIALQEDDFTFIGLLRLSVHGLSSLLGLTPEYP